VLVAHVTEPQLEMAKAVMEETLKKKILPQISEKQFKISFEGMSAFADKVVYAKVSTSLYYISLSQISNEQ